MVKIHIIGGPGSGKSTLAQTVAAKLHIPYYKLDLLGQKNGTNATAHIADAVAIAAQPDWVSEGIYLISVDPLLAAADVIVLLDVVWPVAAWRIIKRHSVNMLRGTNKYPGLKPLIFLLRYAQRYYGNHGGDTNFMQQCLIAQRTMSLPPTVAAMVAFLETYHLLSVPPTVAFVRQYLVEYQAKVVVLKDAVDREQWLAALPNPVCGAQY